MVYDAFTSHVTDNVKVLLAMNNTNLVTVPAGCYLNTCRYMCTLINPLRVFYLIFRKTMSQTLLLTSAKLSTNVRVLSFHC